MKISLLLTTFLSIVATFFIAGCAKKPTAAFSFESTNGRDVQFTNLSSGAIGYRWDFGDGTTPDPDKVNQPNPAHTYTKGGEYFVKLEILGDNGSDEATHKVVVPGFQVGFTYQADSTNPLSVRFTPTIPEIANDSITKYEWNFDDGGSIRTNERDGVEEYTYSSSGSYDVTLIVNTSKGKTLEITQTVKVANFFVNFEYVFSSTNGHEVSFKVLPTTLDPNIVYTWEFGDGDTNPPNTGKTPLHTYARSGAYSVTLTAKLKNEVATVVKRITVSSLVIDFNYSIDATNSNEVIFTASPSNFSDYSWSFGDGIDSLNQNTNTIAHTYLRKGSFEVTLTIKHGQEIARITKTIVVASFQADFTFSYTNETSILFTATTSPNNSSDTTFVWDFGDGNTGNNGIMTHVYQKSGTYQVTLKVTKDKETIRLTKNITIADFRVDFTYNYDSDTQVTFTDSSSVSGAGTTYQWDYGDGSNSGAASNASSLVTHSYANNGTFPVTLTVSQGQTALKVTKNIQIQAFAPDFSYTFTSTKPTEVNFTAGTIANGVNPTEYSWNFGDGSPIVTSTTVGTVKTYAQSGTYNVTLAVKRDNALVKITKSVTVANFIPDFAFAFETTTPMPTRVDFTAKTILNGDNATQYAWDFGDGTETGFSVTHTAQHFYLKSGNYNAVLTVIRDQDTAKVSKTIAVPSFTPNFTSTISNSTNVSCTADPIANGNSPTLYTWSFGDGSPTVTGTSNTTSYNYGKSGTYQITLKVTRDNEVKIITKNVVIQGFSPEFRFTISNTTASFTADAVADATAYNWYFGDGNSSLGASITASRNYGSSGTYQATLKVTRGTEVKTVTKNVVIQSFSSNFTYAISSSIARWVSFNGDYVNGASYYWSFGDGGTSTLRSPGHVYQNNGTYNVTLSISRGRETKTLTRTVVVTYPSITSNLIAYFPMSPAPVEAQDLINNTSSFIFEATQTTNRNATINEAYAFDGVNDSIRTDLTLNTGNKSIAFWAQSNDLATGEGIFLGLSVSASNNLYLGYKNDSYIFGFGDSTSTITPTTDPVIAIGDNSNAWHHYVIVIEGSDMKIYQDKILRGTISNTTNNNTNGYPLIFGSNYDLTNPNRFFSGNIDEVRIFNRVLYQADIDAIFDLGS